jgi:hypothetical protein
MSVTLKPLGNDASNVIVKAPVNAITLELYVEAFVELRVKFAEVLAVFGMKLFNTDPF